MQKVKNRWLIAASAVGIHISIGSAYAWSVFTNPLANQYGWGTTEISLAFSIAIFFLGFSAAFMGKFVEKHGPRKSGMLSALFFGVGGEGSGLATSMESYYVIFLFFFSILFCFHWKIRGKTWTKKIRYAFCIIFRCWCRRFRSCYLNGIIIYALFVLRRYWRDRPRYRVYCTCLHTSKMVSGSSRTRYWNGDYGVWICSTSKWTSRSFTNR